MIIINTHLTTMDPNNDEGVDFSQYFNKNKPQNDGSESSTPRTSEAAFIPATQTGQGLGRFFPKRVIIMIGILIVLIIIQIIIYFISRPPQAVSAIPTQTILLI